MPHKREQIRLPNPRSRFPLASDQVSQRVDAQTSTRGEIYLTSRTNLDRGRYFRGHVGETLWLNKELYRIILARLKSCLTQISQTNPDLGQTRKRGLLPL